MLFMNESEIDEARQLWDGFELLGPATKLLSDLRDVTNQNSDGWAYWPAPCRAARQLQELIQKARHDQSGVTAAALRQAIAPVKAFYTRFRDKLPNGDPLVFPEFPEPVSLRKRPMPGVRRRR